MQAECLETAVQVFVVEDHKCVLWGLERLVDGEQPRMRIVGRALSRQDALEGVTRMQPDVILLDLDLNGESSLEFLPRLMQCGEARVLILTGCRDHDTWARAVMLGARGIVAKDESADVLIKAIMRVSEGELWLDRNTTARVFTAFSNGGQDALNPDAKLIATLTPKERQIVAAVCEQRGANSEAIAARLFMSEHTLRNHLTSIYGKLGVKNRVGLVMYALEHQLSGKPA